MTRRKTRKTFYASPVVEKFLNEIPDRLRSHWIDNALAKVIGSEESKPNELVQLCEWLKSREDTGDSLSKLSGFLSEIFDEFVAIKTGREVLES